MNLAALFALLLSSGVCAKTDFHSTDGATLRVIVCPVMGAPAPPAEDHPPAPPPPKKEERQA